MPITAKCTLEQTELLIQQSTNCTAELENADKVPLRNVNPETVMGSPIIELTDLSNGQVTKCFRARREGGEEYSYDLPPGQTAKTSFFLSDILQFPAAGDFELRALYQWESGETRSPPIHVKVLPAHPRVAHTATAQGGVGALYLSAWLNSPENAKDKFGIWLATISTTGRPQVTDQEYLEEVKRPIDPVLSVPANASALVQWIAWIDNDKLCYLARRSGKTSRTESFPLGSTDFTIVPPLLQDRAKPSEPLPGADVLLIQHTPESPDWLLHLVGLHAQGAPRKFDPITVSGNSPIWAETAYLSTFRCHSFFVVRESHESVLKLASWNVQRPPASLKELSRWKAGFVAADLWLTRDDAVVGAFLDDNGKGADPRYVFRKWAFTDANGFRAGDVVPIHLPKGAAIERAIPRVASDGRPFALLLAGEKQKKWHFCDPDGVVAPLSGPAASLQPPADIVFRFGNDPVLLFADPGRGFQLVAPRAK